VSNSRRRREERREELKTIRTGQKTPEKKTRQSTKGRERREERRFGPKRTEKPRRVKAKPIKDLHSDLDKLKSDTKKLQKQANLTRTQIDDIKQMDREIKKAHQKIKSGKVNEKRVKEIKETIDKIEKVKEEIETPPRGSWYGERKTLDWEELTQRLYDKSNFPSQSEMRKALEEKGMAAKEDFKPKTVGEALTRVAYAAAEMIGGGVREATFGATGSLGAEKRRGGFALQVVGGLATPTPADYAAGYVIAKVAPLKRGRKLLKKLNDYMYPEEMWANPQMAAKTKRIFEDMAGPGHWTTTQIRELKGALKRLNPKKAKKIITFEDWNELNEIAKQGEKIKGVHGYSTYDLRNAKKALKRLSLSMDDKGLPTELFTPAERRQWEKLANKNGISTHDLRYASQERLRRLINEAIEYYESHPYETRMVQVNEVYDEYVNTYWDTDEYINFLKKNRDIPDPNLVASILINRPFKDIPKILEDVADYNLKKPIPKIVESVSEKRKPTEDEDTGEDVDEKPDDETEPTPFPPKEEPKEEPKDETEKTPKEEPDEEDEPEPPPPPDEDDEPEPETKKKPLTEDQKIEIRRHRLQLFNGPKTIYKVKYVFPRGKGQTIRIEARGFVEALNKAQRRRRSNKHHPSLVDITRIKG